MTYSLRRPATELENRRRTTIEEFSRADQHVSDAEYGPQFPALVVNVVDQEAETNSFHGDTYEFFRKPRALNYARLFLRISEKQKFKTSNQFWAALWGGPKSRRTGRFFFVVSGRPGRSCTELRLTW